MYVEERRLDRRSVVRGIGALVVSGVLTGCSTSDDDSEELQAGSLVVENDHVISHSVSVTVVEGPSDNLGNPITPGGTVVVEPNESKRYPEWITDGSSAGVRPGIYVVRVGMNGSATEEFEFEPAPDSDEPTYVQISITEQGELEWSVSVLS